MLLPKTKILTDEKNYRLISCLNISYNLLTSLVGKYMREHTMENDSWDKGKLGVVVRVMGTVDQLIVSRSIMEEVKNITENWL